MLADLSAAVVPITQSSRMVDKTNLSRNNLINRGRKLPSTSSRLPRQKWQASHSYVLDFLGDHKWFAVFTCEQCVRFAITSELFRFAVHLQKSAQGSLGHVELHVVRRKMFFEAGKRFQRRRIGFKRFANRVLARLFAQTVRDVRGMTKRAGEVAFQNVGVQICVFSAADGVDEVRKMILAALK